MRYGRLLRLVTPKTTLPSRPSRRCRTHNRPTLVYDLGFVAGLSDEADVDIVDTNSAVIEQPFVHVADLFHVESTK